MLQRKTYLLLLVIVAACIGSVSWLGTVQATALIKAGAAAAKPTATPAALIVNLPTVTPTPVITSTDSTSTGNISTFITGDQPVAFNATAPSLSLSFSTTQETLSGSYSLTTDKLPAPPA